MSREEIEQVEKELDAVLETVSYTHLKALWEAKRGIQLADGRSYASSERT